MNYAQNFGKALDLARPMRVASVSMILRQLWTVALLAAAVLPAGEARAETREWSDDGIAMDRLEPSPPGDPFVSVPSPFVGGHLVPRFSLLVDHAKNTLLLGDGRAILGKQTFVHAGFSLAFVDQLLASIELPVALFQSGDAGVPYALPDSPTSSSFRPAVGDLRLGLRVRVFGEEDGPFQAALGSYLHIPLVTSSILSEDSVRSSPQLLLGGRYEYLVWSAALGAVLRCSETPSTLTYGAGAALSLGQDRFTLGSEVWAITPVRDGIIPVSATDALLRPAITSAELLFSARLRLGSAVFGASVGPGFGHAPGTASLRALGSLTFSPLPPPPPEPPPVDSDEDGIFDPEDACPFVSGSSSSDPKRKGCPARDRDEDGVSDEYDLCPDRAGLAAKKGCPLDGDEDGVPDEVDVCPESKGGEATDGCPDEDGDGLPDKEDACPKEKGKWHADSKRNGCPEPPVPVPAPVPVQPPAPEPGAAPVVPGEGETKGP